MMMIMMMMMMIIIIIIIIIITIIVSIIVIIVVFAVIVTITIATGAATLTRKYPVWRVNFAAYPWKLLKSLLVFFLFEITLGNIRDYSWRLSLIASMRIGQSECFIIHSLTFLKNISTHQTLWEHYENCFSYKLFRIFKLMIEYVKYTTESIFISRKRVYGIFCSVQ